ncbi:hypothetical protein EsH8_III_000831 [Colletotrichum jinshuiense]
MGRLIQLGALACLYLGAEAKALRWRNNSPSWTPPRETIAAMNMEELGFSPNPTAAPEPASVELKLAKRVRGDDTCGYKSGIATDSIYCGTGSCVINSFFSVVGCCDSSAVSDCRIPTSCLPATSSRVYSSSDTLMQFCSASTRPECVTYVYSGTLFNRYTLYGCGTSEARIVVYANPTDSEISSESTIFDSSTPAVFPSTTVNPTPGPVTSSSVPTGGGGGSTPVGAIVGGVVGGVAAIALVVFGVILLLRKKKKNDPNQNNGGAPAVNYTGPPPPQGEPQMYQQPAQPTQQPSPGGYPPPPGNYPSGFTPVDNRQSMLKMPYDVTTTGGYEQSGISPPASPPPGSPSPTYQSGIPQYAPSHNGPSPTQPSYTLPPPQQSSAPQGGYYNASVPVQDQPQPSPPPQQQQHYQQPSFASELPATRGDWELRELA